MNKQKKSVYEMVKENIIEKIETLIQEGKKGVWAKPWSIGGQIPINWVSQKRYRGINVLLLSGFGCEFLTFKQIQDLQATEKYKNVKLRSGSKGHMVVFFKMLENDKATESETLEPETEEKKTFVLRYYRVFNAADVENLPPRREVKEFLHKAEELEAVKEAESSLMDYMTRESITFEKGNDGQAYYQPSTDLIYVPFKKYFEKLNQYVGVLAHEVGHSTGLAKRLNRFTNGSTAFGGQVYSKEELVAEIFASFTLAHFGIEDKQTDDNSVAYLQNWLSHIKKADSKELVFAANQAQKAFSFAFPDTETRGTD